jgi:hypothetical protein
MLLWVDDIQGNETSTAMQTKAGLVLSPCAVQLQIGLLLFAIDEIEGPLLK